MTRDVVCGANVELQGALVFRPQCRGIVEKPWHLQAALV